MCGKDSLFLPDLQVYVESSAYLTKANYNGPGLFLRAKVEDGMQ
jgi:hypothetical protein